MTKFLMIAVLFACAQVPGYGQTSRTGGSAAAIKEETVLRPIAKTEQERDAFNLAYATNRGGAVAEQVADDFAAVYPDSALRVYLYSRAMHAYQAENNAARMLAMAEKVLSLNPDHCVALVLTATVLADELAPGDSDRTRKIEEINKTAHHAIETVGTGFVPPATASPEQAAVYRTTLQSMAYSALGIMRLKTGDDAGAEKDLSMAAVLTKIAPDPYIWYHLALAQDHRKKYAAALNSVEQALQLASANPELQKLAEIEHDRLAGLAGQRGSRGATGMDMPPR